MANTVAWRHLFAVHLTEETSLVRGGQCSNRLPDWWPRLNAAQAETPAPGPLAGVRVVDFSWYVAGPFCARMLADYGADVIKVERPRVGDPARSFGPFPGDRPHPERSGAFLSLNTSKRGITLDLRAPEGLEIASRLVAEADVVVEAFSPGVMEGLGLGFQALAVSASQLVYCSISNFGQSGPYRDYQLTDFTLYAMGGAMHATGLPDREPLRLATGTQLIQGGYIAATAALMAYYGARRSGIGDWVDVSLFETAMGSIDRRLTHLTAHSYAGGLQRREPQWGTGYPTGFYPCNDGYVLITGGGQFFPRVARMVGRPELGIDARYATDEAQRDPARREEFEATVLLPWILELTKEEVCLAGQEAGVLCGAVNTVADVMRSAQFLERGYWAQVDHPETGELPYPGAPFKMSRTPWAIGRPAPLLGEHNRDVLVEELGVPVRRFQRLQRAGVI